MQTATHLSKHAVRQIVEDFDNYKNSSAVLQVVDVKNFEDQKKNIKARVTLSDGVSRMLAFVMNKAHDQMVSAVC
jgi:hypothetical protein